MLENLVKSLEKAPVVKKGDYDYFVHGISDGVPTLDVTVLKEISEVLNEKLDFSKIDKIVAVEAMGIHLATALSLETGVPLLIIRKRQYGLPGEKEIFKTTGYGESKLYINDLNENENILLIDDVVSTGGTLVSLLNELDNIGVNIVHTVVAVEKGEGKQVVERETNHEILSLVKLDVIGGQVVIESVNV